MLDSKSSMGGLVQREMARLRMLKVSELQRELRSLGINTTYCKCKESLVECLAVDGPTIIANKFLHLECSHCGPAPLCAACKVAALFQTPRQHLQVPVVIVFANELAGPCPCGCAAIDNYLNMATCEPDGHTLASCVKYIFSSRMQAEGHIPVVNLRAFEDKQGPPTVTMLRRSASFVNDLPPGTIAVWTGKYHSRLFHYLFEGRAISDDSNFPEAMQVPGLLKDADLTNAAENSLSDSLRSTWSWPVDQVRAAIYNGTLHIGLSCHLSRAEQRVKDKLKVSLRSLLKQKPQPHVCKC
jgi:hypothetical protein